MYTKVQKIYLAYKAAGREEGKARMEGGGHDKEVASSKKVHSRLQCKNRYPIYDLLAPSNNNVVITMDTSSPLRPDRA